MFEQKPDKIQLAKPSRLKKVLKIVGIVLAVLLPLLAFLFFQFIVGIWPWQMNDVEPMTTEEMEAKAGTFERDYPEIIKGNWEPGADHMQRLLAFDEKRIKELGVNTVSIVPEYGLKKDGGYTFREKQLELSNLVRAKEKGFAVQVAVSFVGIGFGHNYEKKGITLEHYLKVSEELALEWAQIAEDYQVEFLCPQQELDFILRFKFKYEDDEIDQIMEDWYGQILPKIKKVYSGKTMVKISEPERVLKLPGYDYLGFGSFRQKGLDGYREATKEKQKIMQDMAIENNADWFVAEAWFAGLPGGQAKYFEASTQEYLKVKGKKPVGYFFSAWTMPFIGIGTKDEPSEEILKEFFNNQI